MPYSPPLVYLQMAVMACHKLVLCIHVEHMVENERNKEDSSIPCPFIACLLRPTAGSKKPSVFS